jgi:outer membrane protein TolC
MKRPATAPARATPLGRRAAFFLSAGGGALALLGGCTSAHYEKSADRAAYGVINDRGSEVRNMDPNFTIEPAAKPSLDAFPTIAAPAEYLGPDGSVEAGAHVLTLEDALRLAVRHSRTFQSRKEQLYLSALSFTLTRHQLTPLFSGSTNSTYSVTTQQKVVSQIDQLTGLPLPNVKLVEDHRLSGSGSLGGSWLIRDVGRISTAFTTDFLRFITGDPSLVTSSQLSATFVRPLLRDAGFKQQAETLLQAERQMLYDLRDFTQFRKDFIVQVATAYYRVLGGRDSVRTSYANFQGSNRSATRQRALAEEGRVTQADLGRTEQQALQAELNWLNAIRNYRTLIDNFKITLGLSIDSNIVLDERELAALTIGDVDIELDEAVQVALATRLDFQNVKDRFEDAVRRAEIAATTFRPKLDLTATAALQNNPSATAHFALPDPDRYRWNAGLSFDPGLDRTSERNTYRNALIARNSAARTVEQQEDAIKLSVRESWRALDQARRSYLISERSVQLNLRRVEEQNLRAELGNIRSQDLIDAQNDLLSAQNTRAQNLVNHLVARLGFWNNVGLLSIQPDGKWEELKKPDTP